MRLVSVYEGHAFVEIPARWNEMPPELLDFLSMRAAEMSGGRITEHYQHGFRPAASDSGFELPQVLIQIREDGRLSLSQFITLPSPSELAAESPGILEQHRGPFLQQMDLDDVTFDPEHKCLRVDSTMELLVEGTTAVRSASFLTERGMFVVHCYDHASRMASSAPLFDRIIASVQFDDELAYTTRWRDRWTTRHSLALLITLAVAAGLILVAIRRDRQRAVAETTERPLG